MKSDDHKTDYIFQPRGVVEDKGGRVVGMWIKSRRRRHVFLFEKPIERPLEPFTVVYRDIEAGGRIFSNFPVKRYAEVNAINHWRGRDAEK